MQNSKSKVIQTVLIKIAAIIFLVELVVMYGLQYLPFHLSPLVEAVVDSLALTLLSTPFIYLYVILPFIQRHDDVVDKISHMAYHDPLTGLANRRLLKEFIDDERKYNLEHHAHGALLLIDLDGFKAVNDVHGHLAGDHLLKEVASKIKHITRDSDIVSRIGGDEFVVLIKAANANESISENGAFKLAQKIREELLVPIPYKEQTLQINSSIGIRIYNSVDLDFDAILKDADQAMYNSKKQGKGRVTLYQASEQTD